MLGIFLACGAVVQFVLIMCGNLINNWWLVFSPTLFVIADFLLMAMCIGIAEISKKIEDDN